jgi:hypothetical protein
MKRVIRAVRYAHQVIGVEGIATAIAMKLIAEGAEKRSASYGKQGGKKRSKNLTPEQRSQIARKAGKSGGRGRKKKA